MDEDPLQHSNVKLVMSFIQMRNLGTSFSVQTAAQALKLKIWKVGVELRWIKTRPSITNDCHPGEQELLHLLMKTTRDDETNYAETHTETC